MTGRSPTTATLRGVALGAGSDYPFTAEPDGFGPMMSAGQFATAGVDGARWTGGDRVESGVLTFEVKMSGDVAALSTLAGALKQAWGPVRSGVVELGLNIDGTDHIVRGRPRRCPIDWSNARFKIVRARPLFEASDPRLLSAATSSIVLGLEPGGGMTYPLTYPLSFGAGSDSDGSVLNAGNADADWTAVIHGPVTSPRLTLGSTGQYVAISGTVPEGSSLVIDSASRSVLLEGSPRNWLSLTSRWWSLAPGANTVRFRAVAGSGSCTFSWKDASWL